LFHLIAAMYYRIFVIVILPEIYTVNKYDEIVKMVDEIVKPNSELETRKLFVMVE